MKSITLICKEKPVTRTIEVGCNETGWYKKNQLWWKIQPEQSCPSDYSDVLKLVSVYLSNQHNAVKQVDSRTFVVSTEVYYQAKAILH